MTQVREAMVATKSIFEDFCLIFGSEEKWRISKDRTIVGLQLGVKTFFCEPAESTESMVVVAGTKKTLGVLRQV